MKGEFKAEDILRSRENKCPMIIFIYSPGCGHCRNYEPEWNNHYDTFPDYTRNHKDIKTPSIGSISFEDLHDIPIPVRLGSKHRELHNIVDFVPKMVSLDKEGQVYPISNIHNFDNIGEILKGMKMMSGGYNYSKTPGSSKSVNSTNLPPKSPNLPPKLKKSKKKKKKKKKKRRKSKRKKRKSPIRVDSFNN
jgi:hypothetical protein